MQRIISKYVLSALIATAYCLAQADDSNEQSQSANLATIYQDTNALTSTTHVESEIATASAYNYWQLLLDGYAIKPLNLSSVDELTRLYSNNLGFVIQSLQRSAPYISNIIDSLLQRNMPTELALLPVIESGYNSTALSTASAAGIWQFIPETGKRYGLQQNWLRDERRDPLTATEAALNYLQTLYAQFGDWQLALAAYNCGENCVARAQQRARDSHRSIDFAGISPFLPLETRNYVPRLIAVSNVLRGYRNNTNALPRIGTSPEITRILINHPVDLISLARVTGLRYEELSALNGGVLRQVIPPNSVIWLPENKLSKLRTAISESNQDATQLLMGMKPIKSNAGESIHSFADRNAINIDELRKINNINKSLNTIASGTLFVPRKPDEAASVENLALLTPLKMIGEQSLAKKTLSSSDSLLLAKHPEIAASSGWIPGRLKLSGSRSRR